MQVVMQVSYALAGAQFTKCLCKEVLSSKNAVSKVRNLRMHLNIRMPDECFLRLQTGS